MYKGTAVAMNKRGIGKAMMTANTPVRVHNSVRKMPCAMYGRFVRDALRSAGYRTALIAIFLLADGATGESLILAYKTICLSISTRWRDRNLIK
jgi:hypothetical protein